MNCKKCGHSEEWHGYGVCIATFTTSPKIDDPMSRYRINGCDCTGFEP